MSTKHRSIKLCEIPDREWIVKAHHLKSETRYFEYCIRPIGLVGLSRSGQNDDINRFAQGRK